LGPQCPVEVFTQIAAHLPEFGVEATRETAA
jgi:hypothetical protein